MTFDGLISIIIGPNGGGKTNLLDTLVVAIRRYLLATRYPEPVDYGDGITRWQLRLYNNTQAMSLEKHSQGGAIDQVVEIEVELVASDIENMRRIRDEAADLQRAVNREFIDNPWGRTQNWQPDRFEVGDRFTYAWHNGVMTAIESQEAQDFFEYLQLFEVDNAFRSDVGMAPLKLPMLYLPVNRSASGFTSNIALSGFNDLEQRRATDATTSRTGSNVIHLAVGRIAAKFRLLQEDSNIDARTKLREDENLQQLSGALTELGYSWELETTNPLTNEYTIRLTKQGSSFLVDAASSGEKELLTYLFSIYALNVRDALIIVDEPELHLRPRWQSILYGVFEAISAQTGNQFVFATHSPTFISPASIQFVSRVYSRDQKSDIVRLNSADLPNAKHLFNVVNSQNNERIFFTDKVLMVEGLSDRIFFEKLLDEVYAASGRSGRRGIEVVSVGGKGLFPAYTKLLTACKVDFATVADLDYIEQVGSPDLKGLFKLNSGEVKTDVIDNVKSLDGDALVDHIETALASGSWENARATWDYIKSRRRTLKSELSDDEQHKLQEFISSKQEENLFILSRGALEAYLPDGYRGKDIEKLIEFVAAGELLLKIPENGRSEIKQIAYKILGLAAGEPVELLRPPTAPSGRGVREQASSVAIS